MKCRGRTDDDDEEEEEEQLRLPATRPDLLSLTGRVGVWGADPGDGDHNKSDVTRP